MHQIVDNYATDKHLDVEAWRAKLAELDLGEQDIADAIDWAHKSTASKKPSK